MSGADEFAVACRGVSIAYGQTDVVSGLDLAVRRGELVVLLGPSGSGKTTMLSALAGFIPIRSGEIVIDGRVVAANGRSEPPERRNVAVVFQGYALWPHLSALETVAFPMRRRGIPAAEARHRAQATLDRLGIGGLSERRPAELSGGEQQRVGLGRALAREAGLYLFDEPTAHLDAALREQLQAEMADQCRRSGTAAIYATHDTAEALAMADRIVLLRNGRIVQDGAPQAVYERPADLWAAQLTGPASIITVQIVDAQDGHARLGVAGVSQTVSVATAGQLPRGERRAIVRPDWVALGGDLPARVEAVAYRGSHTDYRLETAAGTIGARVPGPPLSHSGEAVGLTLERVWILD